VDYTSNEVGYDQSKERKLALICLGETAKQSTKGGCNEGRFDGQAEMVVCEASMDNVNCTVRAPTPKGNFNRIGHPTHL